MKLGKFIIITLLAVSTQLKAEVKEYKVINSLPNGWRLEQYSTDIGEELVIRFVNSTPCDNNIYTHNLSTPLKNRFYALMLSAKIAKKPVTLYYLYHLDNASNKSCELVSFAADF